MELTLDCQGCGDVIRKLTLAQARRVALRPDDFVVYCARCQVHRSGRPS